MKKFINSIFALLLMISFNSCDGNISDPDEFPDAKPKAVENFAAVAGVSKATLSWTNADPKVTTSFEISYTPNGGAAINVEKDKTSYVAENLENGTEYTFTIVAKNGDTKSEPATVKVTPKAEIVEAKFLTFKFEKSKNPDMALDVTDVVDLNNAVIDDDAKTITFDNISAYIYLDNLIPTFTTSEGATVSIGEITQISGETAANFANEVSYTLTVGQDQTVYKVKLNKNHYANIPDAAFLAKLKALNKFTFNDQDQLDITAEDVTAYNGQIKLNNAANYEGTKIQSLKGIEFFVNLNDLALEYNNVSTLDLRKNIKLTGVAGKCNNFTKVDISKCAIIQKVYMLGNTNLTSIDVSNNLSITKLYLQGTKIASVSFPQLSNIAALQLDKETAEGSKSAIKKLMDLRGSSLTIFYYNREDMSKDESYQLDLTGVE